MRIKNPPPSIHCTHVLFFLELYFQVAVRGYLDPTLGNCGVVGLKFLNLGRLAVFRAIASGIPAGALSWTWCDLDEENG